VPGGGKDGPGGGQKNSRGAAAPLPPYFPRLCYWLIVPL